MDAATSERVISFFDSYARAASSGDAETISAASGMVMAARGFTALAAGSTPARNSAMPASRATAAAVSALSPVIITTRMPAA